MSYAGVDAYYTGLVHRTGFGVTEDEEKLILAKASEIFIGDCRNPNKRINMIGLNKIIYHQTNTWPAHSDLVNEPNILIADFY